MYATISFLAIMLFHVVKIAETNLKLSFLVNLCSHFIKKHKAVHNLTIQNRHGIYREKKAFLGINYRKVRLNIFHREQNY